MKTAGTTCVHGSGISIPADVRARVCFMDVLAEIGDNQAILNDLSTLGVTL